MTRSPEDAIAWANSVTVGYGGMCLKFVRTAFDVPAQYATAKAAWQGAARRHFTSDPAAVPRGVPVYMGANHVALALGGGLMRTTNSSTNRVQTVTIASWGRSYPLVGWAEDLNGVTVWSAGVTTWGILRRGSTGTAVRMLQVTLNDQFPTFSALVVDGIFGPATEAVVREVQRLGGLTVDGIAGPQTLGYLGLA
ncbi:MAG: peptidoglycan-binding protein [Micrococcales bacterium]|nr:peptidoglycan-binding protein [Micrococcales bacterium]MCL2668300.1 peptidoglycan-binding protein [Micrococcales bacterium]